MSKVNCFACITAYAQAVQSITNICETVSLKAVAKETQLYTTITYPKT